MRVGSFEVGPGHCWVFPSPDRSAEWLEEGAHSSLVTSKTCRSPSFWAVGRGGSPMTSESSYSLKPLAVLSFVHSAERLKEGTAPGLWRRESLWSHWAALAYQGEGSCPTWWDCAPPPLPTDTPGPVRGSWRLEAQCDTSAFCLLWPNRPLQRVTPLYVIEFTNPLFNFTNYINFTNCEDA